MLISQMAVRHMEAYLAITTAIDGNAPITTVTKLEDWPADHTHGWRFDMDGFAWCPIEFLARWAPFTDDDFTDYLHLLMHHLNRYVSRGWPITVGDLAEINAEADDIAPNIAKFVADYGGV